MKAMFRSNGAGNARLFHSLGYVLVFLMLTCLALIIGILIHELAPGWHSSILAGVMLFVVIDRMFTYREFKSRTLFSREWIISLGTQWILILLVTRLFLSYTQGVQVFKEELSLFARGYLDRLLSPEFAISILLTILAWYLAGRFLDLIDEIGFNQAAVLREDSAPIDRTVEPPHRRMLHLVFGVGIFLVVLTALTRMNLIPLLYMSGRLPKVEFNRFSGAEAGALLYFVFGLALLSLSRLMSLQTRWNDQRIPISSKHLARQWGLYSLLFLLGLALVVSLLPSGDSFGFFSILGILFGFLFQILLFIFQLVIALILLLFSVPFLFLNRAPPDFGPMLPRMPVLPTEPVTPVMSGEIWSLVRSILLWGTLLIVVIYALVQFLRQSREILPALRNSRIVNWLVLAWQWLSSNMERTRAGLTQLISDGWQSLVLRMEDKRSLPPLPWISLRSLDARRRIFFFYHAMVRRGSEKNVVRKPSQTPSEYAVTLEKAIPPAQDEVDAITQAFMEARYSSHAVNDSDAEKVKEAWARVRHELQRESKDEQSKGK